jgi:hypothetical protein
VFLWKNATHWEIMSLGSPATNCNPFAQSLPSETPFSPGAEPRRGESGPAAWRGDRAVPGRAVWQTIEGQARESFHPLRFGRHPVRALCLVEDAENAFWLTGVITEARLLHNEGKLSKYEFELLKEIFAWFNDHLPCPPFHEKLWSREWTRDAVSWFRDDAKEPLRRMGDIVALLEEHGVPVRFITTEKPGRIVYADRYQTVAETLYWA